ncbi:MAG: YcbK family protein [Deltaproteobacteria bacterium]|nr:YcbK family protein [Deltaproteobacteria bacterium]
MPHAPPLPHDGKLRLYNYYLGDFLEIQYEDQGEPIPEALEKINTFLRSRDSGISTPIDLNILRLADHLQDHFKVDTVEIISAFRTREFNNSLKNTGHNVSPVSFHTQGKALDIHLDEIREETLRDYLLSLKLGGVGYYGPLDFVHMDTGPVRAWSEGSEKSKRKLIGVLEPKAEWQLTSDKNEYLLNDVVLLHWNTSPSPLTGEGRGEGEQSLKITLQHFFRGKWENEKKMEFEPSFKLEAKNLKAGKYRILFALKDDSKIYSSNEFYVKNK